MSERFAPTDGSSVLSSPSSQSMSASSAWMSSIEFSDGRNLTAKVLFARQYARLVFDRALYDRLLEEVLASDPNAPGFTLGNVLAQEEAVALLAEADDYF